MIRTMLRSFAVVAATTSVAVAAAAASLPLPGDQSRWSLDYRAAMQQKSASAIEIHLNGEWTSTICAVRDGEYDAQLQLSDLRFSGDAVKSASPSALAALQTRLSRPLWATYRNDGGLLEMHFPREMSASDRNLLQMIATDLQLVRPVSTNEAEGQSQQANWTAQERDSAGEYSALYVAQPGRILKRKLKYLYTDGVAGAPSNSMRVLIDQSHVTYGVTPRLDAPSQVQSIDGTERIRLGLSKDDSEQVAAETEFHASHFETGRAPRLVGSLERAAGDVVDSPIVTQRTDSIVARSDADDRLLKGDSTQAILQPAFVSDSGKPVQPDRLTALFRSRPDAAPEAETLLIKNGPRKTVTNALGASGSPSAVTVLSELAHNTTLPQELRVDAILAFVQMKHPTTTAMKIPSGMISDPNLAIRSAARMISGALARYGRAEHLAEAERIDASLLALYRGSPDEHERVDLLGALGNSASPATLQPIEEALNDPVVSIRSAAARALRLVSDSEADGHLAEAIVHDSDARVRADAIFATRFHRPLSSELLNALLQAARGDQSTYVRGDALAVLRQNITASPEISSTLAQIAKSDADSGIRHQASNALAAANTSAQA